MTISPERPSSMIAPEPPTLPVPRRVAVPAARPPVQLPVQMWDVAAVSGATGWRPGFLSALVVFPIFLAFGLWSWLRHPEIGLIGWTTTVVWTLPVVCALVGFSGGLITARRMRRDSRRGGMVRAASDALVVIVPTIGRDDTYPALERSVLSYVAHLPAFFPRLRVDIVIEEACPAEARIRALAASSGLVRVVTVPRSYRTPNGTRFKARANQFAHELRAAAGEARGDVWVLHMDDDTGVGPDTARTLARFVNSQRNAGLAGLDLVQGVLAYPREHAPNRWVWLADAVRPGCDISLFAVTTGRGSPLAGLHGELLCVRASVEAGIGWDFGPRTIVEDAEFALTFCDSHPGRSDWFPGLSYGASPATVSDFVRQRERWAWGLLDLAFKSSLPLRRRLMLLNNVLIWVCGPLQHLGVILTAGLLLGDVNTTPASPLLLPLWAVNIAYCVWLYWEGLKINAWASSRPRRLWWEPVALIFLIPLFTLWEAVGVFRGLARFLRNGEASFTVIAKPV